MNISKTTLNYAKRRGIELTIEEGLTSDGSILLCFWEEGENSEWMFSYIMNCDGSFTFRGNIYLSQAVKEELPAFIKNESHLRQIIAFIAESKKDWFKR